MIPLDSPEGMYGLFTNEGGCLANNEVEGEQTKGHTPSADFISGLRISVDAQMHSFSENTSASENVEELRNENVSSEIVHGNKESKQENVDLDDEKKDPLSGSLPACHLVQIVQGDSHNLDAANEIINSVRFLDNDENYQGNFRFHEMTEKSSEQPLNNNKAISEETFNIRNLIFKNNAVQSQNSEPNSTPTFEHNVLCEKEQKTEKHLETVNENNCLIQSHGPKIVEVKVCPDIHKTNTDNDLEILDDDGIILYKNEENLNHSIIVINEECGVEKEVANVIEQPVTACVTTESQFQTKVSAEIHTQELQIDAAETAQTTVEMEIGGGLEQIETVIISEDGLTNNSVEQKEDVSERSSSDTENQHPVNEDTDIENCSRAENSESCDLREGVQNNVVDLIQIEDQIVEEVGLDSIVEFYADVSSSQSTGEIEINDANKKENTVSVNHSTECELGLTTSAQYNSPVRNKERESPLLQIRACEPNLLACTQDESKEKQVEENSAVSDESNLKNRVQSKIDTDETGLLAKQVKESELNNLADVKCVVDTEGSVVAKEIPSDKEEQGRETELNDPAVVKCGEVSVVAKTVPSDKEEQVRKTESNNPADVKCGHTTEGSVVAKKLRSDKENVTFSLHLDNESLNLNEGPKELENLECEMVTDKPDKMEEVLAASIPCGELDRGLENILVQSCSLEQASESNFDGADKEKSVYSDEKILEKCENIKTSVQDNAEIHYVQQGPENTTISGVVHENFSLEPISEQVDVKNRVEISLNEDCKELLCQLESTSGNPEVVDKSVFSAQVEECKESLCQLESTTGNPEVVDKSVFSAQVAENDPEVTLDSQQDTSKDKSGSENVEFVCREDNEIENLDIDTALSAQSNINQEDDSEQNIINNQDDDLEQNSITQEDDLMENGINQQDENSINQIDENSIYQIDETSINQIDENSINQKDDLKCTYNYEESGNDENTVYNEDLIEVALVEGDTVSEKLWDKAVNDSVVDEVTVPEFKDRSPELVNQNEEMVVADKVGYQGYDALEEEEEEEESSKLDSTLVEMVVEGSNADSECITEMSHVESVNEQQSSKDQSCEMVLKTAERSCETDIGATVKSCDPGTTAAKETECVWGTLNLTDTIEGSTVEQFSKEKTCETIRKECEEHSTSTEQTACVQLSSVVKYEESTEQSPIQNAQLVKMEECETHVREIIQKTDLIVNPQETSNIGVTPQEISNVGVSPQETSTVTVSPQEKSNIGAIRILKFESNFSYFEEENVNSVSNVSSFEEERSSSAPEKTVDVVFSGQEAKVKSDQLEKQEPMEDKEKQEPMEDTEKLISDEQKLTVLLENNGIDMAYRDCDGLIGPVLYRCLAWKGCRFSADNVNSLESHLNVDCQQLGDFKKTSCIHCKKVFFTVKRYLEHLKFHGIPKYMCSLCNFSSAARLVSHMKNMHRLNDTLTLPIAYSETEVDRHMHIAVPKSVLEITEYLKKGRSAGKKVVGMVVHNEEELACIKRPVFDEEVGCGQCMTYTTYIKQNLASHLRYHRMKRPVSQYINYVNHVDVNAQKERMFDAMRNHAAYNMPDIECSENDTPDQVLGGLDFVTSFVSDLNYLPTFVPESVRYSCGVKGCNYVGMNSIFLSMHYENSHKGTEIYRCPHCDPMVSCYQSMPIERMRMHMRMHDSKLYKCPFCLYYYSNQRSMVESHLKETHRSLNVSAIEVIRELEVDRNAQPAASASPRKKIRGGKDEKKQWQCKICNSHSEDKLADIEEHCRTIHGIDIPDLSSRRYCFHHRTNKCPTEGDTLAEECKKHIYLAASIKCCYCKFFANSVEDVIYHQSNQHPDLFINYIRLYINYNEFTLADGSKVDGIKQRVEPKKMKVKKKNSDVSALFKGKLTSKKLSALFPEEFEGEPFIKPEIDPQLEFGMPEGTSLKCKICSMKTTCGYMFAVHLYEEFGIHRYACCLCDKRFSCKSSITVHIHKVHSGVPGVTSIVYEYDPVFEKWIQDCMHYQIEMIAKNTGQEHEDVAKVILNRLRSRKPSQGNEEGRSGRFAYTSPSVYGERNKNPSPCEDEEMQPKKRTRMDSEMLNLIQTTPSKPAGMQNMSASSSPASSREQKKSEVVTPRQQPLRRTPKKIPRMKDNVNVICLTVDDSEDSDEEYKPRRPNILSKSKRKQPSRNLTAQKSLAVQQNEATQLVSSAEASGKSSHLYERLTSESLSEAQADTVEQPDQCNQQVLNLALCSLACGFSLSEVSSCYKLPTHVLLQAREKKRGSVYGASCKACGEKLENVQCLKNHILNQHVKEKFKCKICGIQFTLEYNIIRHAYTSHRGNTDCVSVIHELPSDWEETFLQEHSSGKSSENRRSDIPVNASELFDFQKMYGPGKVYHCPYCSYSTKHFFLGAEHTKICRDDQKLSNITCLCKWCETLHDSVASLQAHLSVCPVRLHRQLNKKYDCPDCKYVKQGNMPMLVKHYLTYHQNIETNQNNIVQRIIDFNRKAYLPVYEESGSIVIDD